MEKVKIYQLGKTNDSFADQQSSGRQLQQLALVIYTCFENLSCDFAQAPGDRQLQTNIFVGLILT